MRKFIIGLSSLCLLFFLVSCGGRSVTIIFDAQGGSAVASQSVIQLSLVDEPETTRTGYTFLDWFTEITFENRFDFDKGVTRNMTLYAKWQINQYTIAFEPDNGSVINPITTDFQATISLPDNLTKEGYTFGGWYRDNDYINRYESNRMEANNLTLYAKWDPIYYSVEFYVDEALLATRQVQHGDVVSNLPAVPLLTGYEGSWDFDADAGVTSNLQVNAIYQIKTYQVTFVDQWDHLYETMTVNHGDSVLEPTETPSKTGYTFSGYSEILSELEITEDTVIDVIFTPITYLVTFRVQGTEVKSDTVLYGKAATAPTVNVPGYTFTGWDKSFDNVTGYLEVNAILTANVYQIILHGNGGLFADEETNDTLSGEYQSSMTYTIEPTRSGYQFSGWYLNAEGSGQPVLLTNYSMPVEGLELYAKWTAINYSITYVNLYEAQNGNPHNYNITQSIVLTSPTNRSGYLFLGWFDNEVAGNQITEINAGSIGHKTLYARWSANEYTITFNVNGGTPITPLKVTYGENFTLPIAEKTGYTFTKWQKNGIDLASGTWNLTNNITIDAIYSANEYTITFNVNGGTSIAQLTVTYGESITLPIADKTGYTFTKWQKDGVDVTSGIWTIADDIELDALYSINHYTITYANLNGTVHSNPLSVTIETPSISLSAPSARTGYTFIGWFLAVEGGEALTEITIGSTGNKTLYARWSANVYTIAFNATGDSAIDALIVTFDQSYILPQPTREGYSFAGWTYNEAVFDDGIWTIDANIMIVARWTQWPIISFETNSGSPVQSLSQEPGSAVSEPSDPTKTGYTFMGWYEDSELLTSYNFSLMPSENMTLYAKWSANQYTITFNVNGGTPITPLTVTFDTSFTLPEAVKTGYTFTKWQKNGIDFPAGTWNMPSDVTIDATYQANEYTITFNVNGGTPIAPMTVKYGENYTLPTAVKTGYTFSQWELSEALFTSGTWNLTNHITIDAVYSANEYTITFDIDGNLTTISMAFDSTITAGDVPAIPAKVNYDVTPPYWNNNPIGHKVTGNVTFTAIYVGNPMTVNYHTAGGSIIESETIAYGSKLPRPEDPTRQGFTFLAWYADSELTLLVEFYDPVLADITLYAAWELDFYTWNIESVFLREDLEDSNIVIPDPDQESILFQYVNLYYGLEMSPIQNYEGYSFDYFTIDGVEYSNINELIMVVGNLTYENRIQVYYRKIILTVTFTQDPELFSPENVGDAIVSFRLYYNGTFFIDQAPALVGESGTIHVVWDRTEFTNVKNDIFVYALYYMTGVKSVTFIDHGVIKYIASAIDDLGNPILGVIGSDSLLWELYRPGYRFLGWFTDQTGGTQIERGDLLFADFAAERTTLYARWAVLTPFSNPIILDVEASETEIVISWEIDPVMINGVSPAGFEFILNNRLISNLTTLPILSGNTFTLTILASNHDDFDRFDDLLEPGYHQLSVRVLGDETNHYHSDFSETYLFSLESIFDGDPTEVAVHDYFIIETFGSTKRYIFYTNLEYQFGSSYQFEIVTGQEFASADQNKIITRNLTGSFKFRMIRDGFPTVVYDALVVHDIKQFAYGSNYQNFLQASDAEQNVFLDQATTYYIGSGNNFYLDLRMINNQGSRIPLAQSILDVDLYLFVSGTPQLISEANLDDYIEFLPNNEMKLTSTAVGGTFKLVVKPKYQANSMTVTPLEFIFTVNDGVNVYNNQQLKTYFSNFNVNTINIHASFQAELSSSQKNADGSPINRTPTASNPVTGNVYQRFSTTIDDDQLAIEGNFMTIDGSELPFSNASSGSGTVGFAQSFEIISVQIAIFFYSVKDESIGTTNNNQFHMNNLIVKGNTSTPYVNFSGTAEEIEIQERLMSRNSGGYVGITVYTGTTNFTNMYIFNTVIAITNNAYGFTSDDEPTYAIIDYVKTDNNWANTFYLHSGSGWIIKNSDIGQSGGAAIHMVDFYPAVFDEEGNKISDQNPYLELHDSTTINNWISGEEAWFKAYGMSQVALTLKSGIETGIMPTQRSIIDLITDPLSGLETEKINFILLTEPSTAANVYQAPENITQISGSETILKLDEYITHRSFDFFTANVPGFPIPDQRIIGGQFAFPVGIYSEFLAFYQLIQELKGLGVSEADAPNLATLGAFYGLTATETATVMYIAQTTPTTFREALMNTYPEKVFPKYIEILAPVPVFAGGYSSVIIQFSE